MTVPVTGGVALNASQMGKQPVIPQVMMVASIGTSNEVTHRGTERGWQWPLTLESLLLPFRKLSLDTSC